MSTQKRALLSVTDKTGIIEFAKQLIGFDFQIVSTGGTAKILEQNSVPVTRIEDLTDWPEMMGGRVKTLHPKIFGGILARRDLKEDLEAINQHGIPLFDVVVVNLYAFEKTVSDAQVSMEEAIESIDIGGPSLLRAAAKNAEHVTVVVDPNDYKMVFDLLKKEKSEQRALRQQLALKVFEHTANYDRAISQFLSRRLKEKSTEVTIELPGQFNIVETLRYGENPHQKAALVCDTNLNKTGLLAAKKMQGKEISYNNLLDADSALGLASDLGEGAVVYVKHNNPCGAAVGTNLVKSVELARAVDPVSAFGAVIAVHGRIDEQVASILTESFIEVVIAPEIDKEALTIFQKKPNVRVLEVPKSAWLHSSDRSSTTIRSIRGGYLVQDRDATNLMTEFENAKLVTNRAPEHSERQALRFAWTMAKHVRSNAIVFAEKDRALAIGAGQMSRVDSVNLCGQKAKSSLMGSAVASDAFFPFRDGIDQLAALGAKAVIQPGGSVRDEEVIAAANEHGIAMLFTGVRHFCH